MNGGYRVTFFISKKSIVELGNLGKRVCKYLKMSYLQNYNGSTLHLIFFYKKPFIRNLYPSQKKLLKK